MFDSFNSSLVSPVMWFHSFFIYRMTWLTGFRHYCLKLYGCADRQKRHETLNLYSFTAIVKQLPRNWVKRFVLCVCWFVVPVTAWLDSFNHLNILWAISAHLTACTFAANCFEAYLEFRESSFARIFQSLFNFRFFRRVFRSFSSIPCGLERQPWLHYLLMIWRKQNDLLSAKHHFMCGVSHIQHFTKQITSTSIKKLWLIFEQDIYEMQS